MPKCPFCNSPLEVRVIGRDRWLCECGEWIPAGFEIKDEENCENCPVLYCPQRTKPDNLMKSWLRVSP